MGLLSMIRRKNHQPLSDMLAETLDGTLAESGRMLSEKEREELIEEVMATVTERMADGTHSRLYKSAPKMPRHRRRDDAKWRRRIRKRWGIPLEVFRMFLECAHETGGAFDQAVRPDKKVPFR